MKLVNYKISNLKSFYSIIIFSIFTFQILLSQDVTLSFGTVDEESGSMEILIENSTDVYGFQFNVTGVNITSATAGEVVPGDWMVSASGSTVLGFSLMGTSFPAGSGILVTLTYEVTGGDICIENGVVSGEGGAGLEVGYGECMGVQVETVTLDFGIVDQGLGTAEIYLNSPVSISSFAIGITGVQIESVFGGSTEENNFILTINPEGSIIFGSNTGTLIAPDNSLLTNFSFSEVLSDSLCIDSESNIYDEEDNELEVIIGDCQPLDQADPIFGCTDESACNFDTDATDDDGSCEYPEECYDCSDECICEEDCAGVCGGEAVVDDCGECEGDNSTCTGCLDPDAENYCEDCIISCDDCCEYAEIDPVITLISPTEGDTIYAAGVEFFLDANINLGDQFIASIDGEQLEELYEGDSFIIHVIDVGSNLFDSQSANIEIQTVNVEGNPYDNPESQISITLIFSPPEEFYTEQSTFQAFYFLYDATSGGIPLEYNDWIGAYCNDTCVGNKWWYSEYTEPPVTVPAFGNDGGLPGYCQIGDEVSFRMYDNSESSYYEMITSSIEPEGGWSNFGFYTVDSLYSLVTDCNGEVGGGAYFDDCGVCAGGSTGIDPNDVDTCTGSNLDCNCECFGDAVIDECSSCCDGNTGTECSFYVDETDFGGVYDCNGDCFGVAYTDVCEYCCDGETGVECSYYTDDSDYGGAYDCTGVCDGVAVEDECNICDGSSYDCTDSDNECICAGCTDTDANNFDPDVTIDDGTCIYNVTVAINEFFYRAALGDSEIKDYVELINLTNYDYDLTDWQINGNTIPSGILPSGGFFIITETGGAFYDSTGTPLFPGIDIQNSIGVEGFQLSTNSDEIVLYNAEGELVDSMYYDFDEGWPVGNTNRGHALELTDPALDNTLLLYWESTSEDVVNPIMYNDDGEMVNYGTPLTLNSNYSGTDVDCANVIFGNAFIDDCGDCVGGTTGLEENYNMDCTGECYGESIIDDCGICSGGNSGLDSNDVEECTGPDLDCNCECYGDADYDGCGVCCGGNSETDCSFFNDDSDFGGAYDCLENCPDDEGYIGPGSGELYEEFFGLDECGECQGLNNNCNDPASECICAGCTDDAMGIAPDIYGCCRDQFWSGSSCIGGNQPNEDGYCEADNGYNSMNFDPLASIDDGTCVYFYADIQSIFDVPEDQGGRVYLTFKRAFFDTDTAYVPRETEGYSIERLDDIYGDSMWVNIASGYAYGSEYYIFEVPTVIDSNDVNSGISQFRVIASMDEGIWISPSGFGYSIDNLSPGIPQGLALSIIDDLIQLEWNPNSESDLQYYNIYSRIYDPEPWFWTLENSTANSEYLLENTELIMEYTVTAVDHNGNESDFSNSVTNDVLNIVGNTIPEEFTLYPSFPNPFNPVTNINYTLPIGGIVVVSIFDIFGNLNDVIFEGEQVSGEYFLQWNADEMASGIYIVQVKIGSEIRTQKILLLK